MGVAHINAIYTVLRTLEERIRNNDVKPGQVICLGLTGVRRRLGEHRWPKVRNLVLALVEKAIREACDMTDIYLPCQEDAFIIVFASPQPNVTEAKVLRIVRTVGTALFGDDSELDGMTIRSAEQTEAGLALGPEQDASAVFAHLLQTADHRDLQDTLSREAVPGLLGGRIAEAFEGQECEDIRASLRFELQGFAEQPVQIGYWPVTDMIHRGRCTCWVRPTRKGAFDDEPFTDYEVLGEEPGLRDYVSLDIRLLEQGMLHMLRQIRQQRRTHLFFNVHFDTLASRQGLSELTGLLREVPAPYRKLMTACIWHVPGGIPTARLGELILRLSLLVGEVAVVMRADGLDEPLTRLMAHLRAARVGMLVVRLPASFDGRIMQNAFSIGDQARQAGLSVALDGIYDDAIFPAVSAHGFHYSCGAMRQERQEQPDEVAGVRAEMQVARTIPHY